MSDVSFAVEINDKYTRVCDLEILSDKIELSALGSFDTVTNFFETDNQILYDGQTDVIRRLYQNLKIQKNKVNIIIPDTHTFSQIVMMPKLKEKELIAAIRYQADEFIPLPIEETYLDLEVLYEDTQQKKLMVLIVAAPKRIVDTVFTIVQKAGLEPMSLENEMSAAGRFFSEIVELAAGIYVVVNFGYFTTSLYLIDGETKTMLLTRTVKIGLDLFIKDLKVNLNWDERKIMEGLRTIGLGKSGSVNLGQIILPVLKELLDEIEKFRATARENLQKEATSIVLFNYDTNIAFLTQYMHAYFRLPVMTAPLQDVIAQNPISQSFGSELSSYVSVISGNFR